LREKYEQVNATHDKYQRQLDEASARMKKLQAENEYVRLSVFAPVPSVVLNEGSW
jgi:hypothetical protein